MPRRPFRAVLLLALGLPILRGPALAKPTDAEGGVKAAVGGIIRDGKLSEDGQKGLEGVFSEPKKGGLADKPLKEKLDNYLNPPPGGSGAGPKTKDEVAGALKPLVPRYPSVLAGPIAKYDLGQGRPEEARRDADAAIAAGDTHPDNYLVRGAAAYRMGDKRAAAEDARRALDLDPANESAEALLKLSEKKVEPPDARAIEKSIPALLGGSGSAGDPGPGSGGAGADSVRGGGRAAPGRRAAILGPDARFVRVAVQRGLDKEAAAQLAMGDPDRALALADKSIQANPLDAKARFMRASILLRRGLEKEAAAEAGRLLELLPGHAGALNIRALALARQRDYDGALRDAQAALAAKADSAAAYYNLAFALAGLGKRAEAVEALRKAAALDPRFGPVLKQLLSAPKDMDPAGLFGERAQGAEPGRPPAPVGSWPRGLLFGACGAAFLYLGARLAGLRRPKAASPAGAAPPDAKVLAGAYRVESELGRGTMGVVYRAVDLTLRRPVAVKMLRDYARRSRASAERLLQEARLVAALKHPNIVQIYAALMDGEDILLVFEWAAGRPLSRVLEDFDGLPLADVKSFVRQAAEALDYAHGHRVIHRDLKPSNIMVSPEGHVSVMDFGLAHEARLSAAKETSAPPWGSPAYMAPEQELGTVSAASDIYSLGVCAYEMLTGKPPFPGPDWPGQKRRMEFAPPSRRSRSLGAEADALMRRALEADPARRFATARELAAALEALPGR